MPLCERRLTGHQYYREDCPRAAHARLFVVSEGVYLRPTGEVRRKMEASEREGMEPVEPSDHETVRRQRSGGLVVLDLYDACRSAAGGY